MTKHIRLTLAFLLTVTAITGCSGGRLRNLISRSDYKTLEEVEAEDTLTAEREAAADQKAFANAEKELSESKGLLVSDESAVEADKADAPEEKKSRFSLAGLFRRGDDSEEVTPDPFVAGGELAASEFEAVDEGETKTASLERSETTGTEDRGVAKTEEQSVEDLFREKAKNVESRATAELERAIAETNTEGNDLPDSFSDYLKANRDNLEDAATEQAPKSIRCSRKWSSTLLTKPKTPPTNSIPSLTTLRKWNLLVKIRNWIPSCFRAWATSPGQMPMSRPQFR